MEKITDELEITVIITKDGVKRSVGFRFTEPTTKEYFREQASALVEGCVRKLQMEKVFI